MAGARAVEEILARGGAEQFAITMFGDEPYGNYNRIMLSTCCPARRTTPTSSSTACDWYAENDITLHAGRAGRPDRPVRQASCFADDGTVTPYDKLIIATGSRSFMPPMDGHAHATTARCCPGVFAFRTIDDTRGDGPATPADDHQRAVVIGGGLLGLEAARGLQSHGLDVDVVHAGRHLMNAQLDAQAGAILRRSVEELGIEVHHRQRGPPRSWAPDKVARRQAARRAAASTATWWWSPPASGRTSTSP